MELQTARRWSFSLRPSRCSPPRPNQKARTLCRWDSQRNLLTGRNDHGSSLHAAEWRLCLLSPTPTTTATRSSTVRFLGKKNPDSSPAVSLRAPRQFLWDRPQLQASPCCQSFPCLFSFKIITPSFDVCFLALMTFLLGKSRWLSKGHPSSLRSRDCFLLFSTPIALFSSVDSQHGMCWLSPPFPLAEREPEQEKQGPVERCREGSHRIREACWAKTTMLPLGNSPPALLRTLCPGSLAAVWSSGASSNLLEGRAGRSLQPLTTLCLHGCCSHLLDPFCPSQLCVQGAQKQSTWAFSLGNWSYQQHPGTTLWVLSLFSRVLQSPQTMLREALLARLSLTQQSD